MRCNVKVTPDEHKPDREWALEQGLDTIGVVWRYDWPADSKHAGTPFELWTPSRRKGEPVPRFATLEEAVTAADEIAEERARTTTLKPVEVHRQTYRGTEVVITRHPATAEKKWRRFAHHTLRLDGRLVNCPAGQIETVIAKTVAAIDVMRANEDIQPKLVTLVDARPSIKDMPGWDDGAAPEIGDAAYVYARGLFRRGLVVAVTRTRATVAYVTASSPSLVHRKADRFAELATG